MVIDSVMPTTQTAVIFGENITTAWRQSVESILEVGRLLIEAKAELSHGEFGRMVEQHCPFGKRTAQTLMKIAAHPALANAQHVAHLPASWSTLAELSRMEPEELGHAVRNHWIQPDMTREDVSELRNRVKQALGKTTRRPRPKTTTERETDATEPDPFPELLRSLFEIELRSSDPNKLAELRELLSTLLVRVDDAIGRCIRRAGGRA